MGIRTRLSMEGETYHRVFSDVLAAFRRVAAIRLLPSLDGISVGMFASGSLPYEASRTYRTIMAEFECRRAQTQTEAQRALLSRI